FAGYAGCSSRHRGGDGDVVADECSDQTVRLGSAGGHVFESVVTFALAAGIRLLAWIHLGIDEESVLEIVDPDFRRFLIGDGAEMASHLEASLVCLLHCRS